MLYCGCYGMCGNGNLFFYFFPGMCSTVERKSNRTGSNSTSCPDEAGAIHHIPVETSVSWAVAYSIVALIVLLGNSLVVLSFLKIKRLRSRTNYFIVSLSVTDWFVGAISLPWWISLMFLTQYPHSQSWFHPLHEIWIVFDILGGVGSILHLVALTWDRLCAVTWPLAHRTYSKQRYICIVCFIWLCAIVVAGCSPHGRVYAATKYNVSVIILFFFLPLALICIAQTMILHSLRKPSFLTSRRKVRLERRVTRTITVMVALFVIGWLPFFTLSLLAYTNPKLASIPWQAVCAVKLLQYSNSAVNPLLYATKFPHFKRGYQAVLCPCREVGRTAQNVAVNFRKSLSNSNSTFQERRRSIRKWMGRKLPTPETSRDSTNTEL